jgi:hypothetical protein
MEHTNNVVFEEVKSVLLGTKPEEFVINQHIKKLEEIKKKHKKPIAWQHDDWDNWYNG